MGSRPAARGRQARFGMPRPSGIRGRILLIALLPALLAEIGLTAHFTRQALATAEHELRNGAARAAHHLADALPYALVSGDLALAQRLLEREMEHGRLAFARVTDPEGRTLASAGDTLRADLGDARFRQRSGIRLPAADLPDDPPPAGTEWLGEIEVGVAPGQLGAARQDAFIRAALLLLAALALTGALAWRLSGRLTGELRTIGQTVESLAGGDAGARAQLPPAGEVGTLAAGVDRIGEQLQAHRGELEQRIREATAELAAGKDMAERANQAKSRFFAAASHDLRQPLHALSLFVDALKGRSHQTEVQTLIDNIAASTAAMELLFNALLDISQLDAGAIEPRPVHFPLQTMLADLAKQFGALAAEKQLRLRFRPCAATLYSDPLLIERILVNLLANAIRYTDDGGVLVACRRRGRNVRISVYDTGRGIPPELQESVFQEFVQLHNPARDRSKGLGLGLAIVSRLGRLLGHRIDLRSRPDHGSVFSIDVPCGDPALVQPAAPVSAPGRIPADALVLMVDDESAILRGMAELFDNWGIDLVTAHSAGEAEHWLDSLARVPDVIVSDYRLPEDTDGIVVVNRLREKYGRDIPAILVTGDTAPDTIQRISQAGFPLLHKPLRPAKLRALLTHLVLQARAPAVG